MPEKKHFMSDPYYQRWVPHWHSNAMENYSQIKKDFRVDEKMISHNNCCISGILKPIKRPVIITGSGPSLEKALPLLKDWKHHIFATPSNSLALVKHDKEPDYLNAFDSLHTLFDTIKAYKGWKKSALLTHPYAEPKTIKWWKGRKYYYRRLYPGLEFSELILPMMFPWIKIGMRVTGCVSNNSISIAEYLGYDPIFLVGVDFGWIDDDLTRSTYFTMEDKKWIEMPPEPKNRWKNKKEIFVSRNGRRTFKSYMTFKHALFHIWGAGEANIIDCSDGIIDELSKADIEKVIEKQGSGFDDLKKTDAEKKSITEQYFKKVKEGTEFAKENA